MRMVCRTVYQFLRLGNRLTVRRYATRPECCSCGTRLHTEESRGALGYIPPEVYKRVTHGIDLRPKKVRKPADLKFESLYSRLPEHDRKLLGFSEAVVDPEELPENELEKRPRDIAEVNRRLKAGELICQRCHGLYRYNNALLLPQTGITRLVEMLPKRPICIVHVIDAYDFPMTFIPVKRLLDMYDREVSKVIYVVNRIDLLVPSVKDAEESLRPVFAKILQKLMKIDEEGPLRSKRVTEKDSLWKLALGKYSETQFTVEDTTESLGPLRRPLPRAELHLVSSHLDWNIDKLFLALSEENYIFGFSNVGKSRLIQSLMFFERRMAGPNHPLNKRQPGIREIGPGASFMPGMTRQDMTLKVIAFGRIKTVVDLPGVEDRGGKFWESIRPDCIKGLVKGRVFRPDGRESVSVGVSKCLNVGGILYIESPDMRFIAWNMIGKPGLVNTYVHRDLNRALEVVKVEDASKPMCLDASKPYAVELVGEFRVGKGGIDVLIRGLGYIEIRLTGKVPLDGALIRVHALEGVSVGARQPIFEVLKDKRRGAHSAGKLQLSPEHETPQPRLTV